MEMAGDALIAAGGDWVVGQGKRYGKRAWGGLKRRVKGYFKGRGDYELNANSLIDGGGKVAAGTAVQIVPKGNGDIQVVFKEYLGEITTHPVTVGQFWNTSYSINAGLIGTFPWLCMIAQQFDYAKYNGVVFCYQSSSSEATTAFNLGSILMATEYDILDPAFSSKQEMMNCAYSQMFKPSEDGCHGIECAPGENPREIFINRQYNVPAGADLREYDLGNFQIATQGSAAAQGTVLGSLFVVYDITLKKNQMYNGPFLNGALNVRGTCITTSTNNFAGVGSLFVQSGGNMNISNTTAGGPPFPNVVALDFRITTNPNIQMSFNSDLVGTSWECFFVMQGQVPGGAVTLHVDTTVNNWVTGAADASQGQIADERYSRLLTESSAMYSYFFRIYNIGQFARIDLVAGAGLIVLAPIFGEWYISQIANQSRSIY